MAEEIKEIKEEFGVEIKEDKEDKEIPEEKGGEIKEQEEPQENINSASREEIAKGPRKRQIAYKLRIANLINNSADFEKFNFIDYEGKKIMRVNIIANIIDKFISEGERKFASITLDDASSQIRARLFGDDIKKFDNMGIGDSVLAIGMLRFFNNELYVLPEIIRKVDSKWLLIRKLEIGKTREEEMQEIKGIPREDKKLISEKAWGNSKQEVKEEKVEVGEEKNNPIHEIRIDILKMLKEKDGLDIEKIILSLNKPVDLINNTIKEMIEEAEVYEPKPGMIRLL